MIEGAVTCLGGRRDLDDVAQHGVHVAVRRQHVGPALVPARPTTTSEHDGVWVGGEVSTVSCVRYDKKCFMLNNTIDAA